MKSWNLNPANGDYVLDALGSPEQTDSLLIPAYIRLKAPRTRWLYAPDTEWGSDFYTVRKRHSALDGSLCEQIGSRALKPLIDDGRASKVTLTATVQTRTGIGLETKIADAGGNVSSATFKPIT